MASMVMMWRAQLTYLTRRDLVCVGCGRRAVCFVRVRAQAPSRTERLFPHTFCEPCGCGVIGELGRQGSAQQGS